jgi:hypothetical protein
MSQSGAHTGWTDWWQYSPRSGGNDMCESGDAEWAAVCKRNAEQALAGRSARIKSAIAQMETICPPIGAQP